MNSLKLISSAYGDVSVAVEKARIPRSQRSIAPHVGWYGAENELKQGSLIEHCSLYILASVRCRSMRTCDKL